MHGVGVEQQHVARIADDRDSSRQVQLVQVLLAEGALHIVRSWQNAQATVGLSRGVNQHVRLHVVELWRRNEAFPAVFGRISVERKRGDATRVFEIHLRKSRAVKGAAAGRGRGRLEWRRKEGRRGVTHALGVVCMWW